MQSIQEALRASLNNWNRILGKMIIDKQEPKIILVLGLRELLLPPAATPRCQVGGGASKFDARLCSIRSRRRASALPASKLGRSCAVPRCASACRADRSGVRCRAISATARESSPLIHAFSCAGAASGAHSLHPSYPKPSRRKTARDLDRRMHAWRGSRHAAARRHGKCKAQAADMSATQKLDVSWRQGVFGDAPKSEAVSFLSG